MEENKELLNKAAEMSEGDFEDVSGGWSDANTDSAIAAAAKLLDKGADTTVKILDSQIEKSKLSLADKKTDLEMVKEGLMTKEEFRAKWM